jgi:hypothetical protein
MMIAHLLLLDIRPGPPNSVGGAGELIFVAIVVLMLTLAAVGAFVFLVRRLRKTAGPGTRIVVGDACLNLDGLASNRATGKQNQSSRST